MITLRRPSLSKSQSWILCVTVVLSFAAGSLTSAGITHVSRKRAESDRVFQLMIYHTLPGKVPELESIFRSSHKLQAKYLDVIGYWVPNDDPAWKDTFVYLIAHPSKEAAERNWHAFHSDPAFPPYRASAAPLIQHVNDDYRVEEIYMRPTDFSSLH
jgi:hypothetical protein